MVVVLLPPQNVVYRIDDLAARVNLSTCKRTFLFLPTNKTTQ